MLTRQCTNVSVEALNDILKICAFVLYQNKSGFACLHFFDKAKIKENVYMNSSKPFTILAMITFLVKTFA